MNGDRDQVVAVAVTGNGGAVGRVVDDLRVALDAFDELASHRVALTARRAHLLVGQALTVGLR